MKKLFTLFLMFACASTLASTDNGYDPAVLVQERPSEYTRYLSGLFNGGQAATVSPVKAKPKIKKGTLAYSFRTAIQSQARLKAANFAGDWILVVVPQGTAAYRYFLTNAKTGAVVDPDLMTSNGTPLFRPDRSLLVISGSVGEKNLADAKMGVYGGPKAFRWKTDRFESVEL